MLKTRSYVVYASSFGSVPSFITWNNLSVCSHLSFLFMIINFSSEMYVWFLCLCQKTVTLMHHISLSSNWKILSKPCFEITLIVKCILINYILLIDFYFWSTPLTSYHLYRFTFATIMPLIQWLETKVFLLIHLWMSW